MCAKGRRLPRTSFTSSGSIRVVVEPLSAANIDETLELAMITVGR